jgi:hypothetical protein
MRFTTKGGACTRFPRLDTYYSGVVQIKRAVSRFLASLGLSQDLCQGHETEALLEILWARTPYPQSMHGAPVFRVY